MKAICVYSALLLYFLSLLVNMRDNTSRITPCPPSTPLPLPLPLPFYFLTIDSVQSGPVSEVQRREAGSALNNYRVHGFFHTANTVVLNL
jgi:hypothetical protein